MIIGKDVLIYKELVSAMTKCHTTIEVIRGAATGAPAPNWPNAKLRTDPGIPAVPTGALQLQPADYVRELSRLMITHS